MAKFTDTPKWKNRAAYLNATAAPKQIKPNPQTVKCPTCNAARRMPCHTEEGKMRRPHRSRRWKAQQVAKARARTARYKRARQKQRWDGVTVRYVCPVCGGDHSRSEHNAVAR